MKLEKLKELVKTSYSINEVLVKAQLNVSSKTYNRLKEILDKNNIDYSHFDSNMNKGKEKKELSEILQKNTSYSSQRLKKRLIKEGLKEDKCEICGCSNIWNGQPLTLQLDHINGDHYDNRLENLRILCPNCHTQTETFSKNNAKELKHYYCRDCGKEITKGATYCKNCVGKHKKDNKNWPSKEILLEEILSGKPFTKIGAEYNASDNALRKHCRKIGLPSTKKEIKEYMGQLV